MYLKIWRNPDISNYLEFLQLRQNLYSMMNNHHFQEYYMFYKKGDRIYLTSLMIYRQVP
jgi:hypothetical protein